MVSYKVRKAWAASSRRRWTRPWARRSAGRAPFCSGSSQAASRRRGRSGRRRKVTEPRNTSYRMETGSPLSQVQRTAPPLAST